MIEPGLFFGLGFLAAGLVALVILPLIHARAVRLTKRRLENAGPLSIAEIQAEKDRLRAEFALSTRRLELSIEQLRNKTAAQFAEIGQKTTELGAIKAELEQQSAETVAMAERDRASAGKLQAIEQALAAANEKLRENERALADSRATIARLTREGEERAVVLDSGRIEIVALNTQIATLRDKGSDLEERLQAVTVQRDRSHGEVESLRRALDQARSQTESLEARTSELHAALRTKTADADAMAQRLAALEPRLAALTQALAATAQERDRLRDELATARSVDTELRGHIASLERRAEAEIKQLTTERGLLENRLEVAREERTRLIREVASLRRTAEESWEIEHQETALLRERIKDVAAEVARLTSTLEGSDSPIDSLVSNESAAPFVGAGPGNALAATPRPRTATTLADRIRMLQARAPGASAAS